MLTRHGLSPANKTRLSSCHGDSLVFSCRVHRPCLTPARCNLENAWRRGRGGECRGPSTARGALRLPRFAQDDTPRGMPEHVHLLLSEPQRDTSSDGTAPLKPKPGLSERPAGSRSRSLPTGRLAGTDPWVLCWRSVVPVKTLNQSKE
jgi:hypothetical protein